MPVSSRRGERGDAQKVVVLILGGIALMIALAVLLGLLFIQRGVRVQTEQTGDRQRVEIETPFGGITVLKADDAAEKLKLPIYPGAIPRKEAASVRLWGRIGDEEGALNITVAQFTTTDTLAGVDDWYRKQLGPLFERETDWTGKRREKEPWREHIHIDPGDVAYVHEMEGGARGVVLEPKGSELKITLFEVGEARHQ